VNNRERGQPASIDRHRGVDLGRGADAGGGGTAGEDYDQDSAAGSGQEPPHGARPIDRAVDRQIDPDEGI
jgi:hypothetical protein